MPLRKGNVTADVSAAVEEAPPFEPDQAPAAAPPPPPPAVEAPQAAPAAAATTAPAEQQAVVESTAQQAAPAQPPVPAPPSAPAQMPATKPGAGALATSPVTEQLAQSGFEDLEMGFGAFPIISLQNTGLFETSEGGSLGSSFNCILLGSRAKYICKNDQRGPAEDFFYSYDREYSLGGEPVADIIAGWTQQGWKHEWKKYLDVQAQLVTDDEDNGALVMLSIPPTSIARFSGYVATLAGRYQKEINRVVTRCELGDKVTRVQYPFHPWKFSFLRDV